MYSTHSAFYPPRRSKLQKFFFALTFLVISMSATAAPITGNNAKVVLCMAPPEQGRVIFNPMREYGNPIRYVRLGEPLYVFLNGAGYSLDLDGAVQEAMAEWTAAIPSLRFQTITQGFESRKTWKIKISDADVTRLGSGYRIGVQPSASTPEIVFYHKAFSKAAQRFGEYAQFMESKDLLSFMAFLLRQVAKHEIGHMLGFMHPPGAHGDGLERDATGCPTQAVFEPTNIEVGPPIMVENLFTMLRLMTDHFGRPLRLEDIQISPQEAAIARAVFEQVCPVNIELDNTARSARSSNCPRVSQVITRPIPAINELLVD